MLNLLHTKKCVKVPVNPIQPTSQHKKKLNSNQTEMPLTAFFKDSLDKPAPVSLNHLDFNETRANMVAVASGGPYANHLHLTPDR